MKKSLKREKKHPNVRVVMTKRLIHLCQRSGRAYFRHKYLGINSAFSPQERDWYHNFMYNPVKKDDLENSILKLSEYLVRHHGEEIKFIMLVDEFDVPITNRMFHSSSEDLLKIANPGRKSDLYYVTFPSSEIIKCLL